MIEISGSWRITKIKQWDCKWSKGINTWKSPSLIPFVGIDMRYTGQVCKRSPSSLAGEHIGNVALWQCCLFVCVYWEGNTRGQGARSGPWGAHWPPVTYKLINMPLSVTVQLWLLPHCWPALFSHELCLGLFVTGWVTRSHTGLLLGQQTSLESLACLLVKHHTGGTGVLLKGCCEFTD